MITIGLTGSIAMGKSEVAAILRAEGIPVFDADHEVHKLYDSKEGAALLQELAPDAVIEHRVDRQRLSDIVVKNPDRLGPIEKVIHAEIARRRKIFASQSERGGHGIIAVDVPLLFEKAGDKDVDVTVVVSAPAQVQRARAMARPGMTEAKLDMILQRQMPDAEKQQRADHVIHNTGSLDDLRNKTLAILATIRKEHRF